MFKQYRFTATVCLAWGLWASVTAQAAALTEQEVRWLQAVAPVRAYASHQGLPVDVVVQPQDAAGLAPLATAYVGGRCKLVFSMRGNPAVQDAEAGLEEPFRALAIETMAAHELGHCWRYQRGDWHVWPAGFATVAGEAGSVAARWAEMAATRREEGYADLVALAYIAEQRPADYAAVYRWLVRVRDDQPIEGAHHDTRVWLGLASEVTQWRQHPGEGLFERAAMLWRAGLAQP